MYAVLTRICTALNSVVEQVLWMIGLSMALLVAVQVFCRYVLNGSLFWSEELARYMLVWLTFLGAVVAYYRGSHPGVDLLVKRLPATLQRCSRALVHGLAIALSISMVVAGVQFAWFIRMQVSPALGIPKWLILVVIPLSGGLLLLHSVHGFLSALRNSSGKVPE